MPHKQDHVCNFADIETLRYRPNGKPWRGSREKDPSFIRCFVDCLIDEGGIVFDWSANTGNTSINPTYQWVYSTIISNVGFSIFRCFCNRLRTFRPSPYHYGT